MRLIDANIFIYAAGAEHPLKEPCLKILRSVENGSMSGATDIEVLQELLNFYQRRREVGLAEGVVAHALTLFPDPIVITVDVIVSAMETLQHNPRLEARDAIHAAVVLEHGLEGIVSADRGYDELPGVTRFDPLEL